MTTKELITHLKTLDPDGVLTVVMKGADITGTADDDPIDNGNMDLPLSVRDFRRVEGSTIEGYVMEVVCD